MSATLNSIRMRSERDGVHISGAERLVPLEQLETVAVEMLQRALNHPRGGAAQISLRVDCIDHDDIASARLPDLYNNQVVDYRQGRALAGELLVAAGVAPVAMEKALQVLAAGAAADGKSMRGAMLIDADSGKRLENDRNRGVRVSRMDLTPSARKHLLAILAEQGLNNQHVVEALILAAKVISAPEVVAELCWSDDPDYLAGYIASRKNGYQRISQLKPAGDERGGRAFFVRCRAERLGALVEWLEQQPLLVDCVGEVFPPRYWKDGHETVAG